MDFWRGGGGNRKQWKGKHLERISFPPLSEVGSAQKPESIGHYGAGLCDCVYRRRAVEPLFKLPLGKVSETPFSFSRPKLWSFGTTAIALNTLPRWNNADAKFTRAHFLTGMIDFWLMSMSSWTVRDPCECHFMRACSSIASKILDKVIMSNLFIRLVALLEFFCNNFISFLNFNLKPKLFYYSISSLTSW